MQALTPAPSPLPRLVHALRALRAIAMRELLKFVHQRSRFLSALVRPLLWLAVFAAGFRNVFGVSIVPPYDTYVTYDVYIAPGLIGMVLLFNGMQSSLAMVYDREMGLMRLLLVAPLPRWWVLACKLFATALLSLLQALAFVAVAYAMGTELPLWGAHTPMLLLALISAALSLAPTGFTNWRASTHSRTPLSGFALLAMTKTLASRPTWCWGRWWFASPWPVGVMTRSAALAL